MIDKAKQRKELIELGITAGQEAIQAVKTLDPRIRAKVVEDQGARGKVRMSDYVAREAVLPVLSGFAEQNDIKMQLRTEEQGGDPIVLNSSGRGGIIYADVDEVDGTINANELTGVWTSNVAFTYAKKKPKEQLVFRDFEIGVIALSSGDTFYGDKKQSFLRFQGKTDYPVRTSSYTSIEGRRVIADPYPTRIFAPGPVTDELLGWPFLWLDKATGREMRSMCSAGAEICGLFYLIPRKGDTISESVVAWVSPCQPSENLTAGYVIAKGAGAVITDWENKPLDRTPVAMGARHELTDVIISANPSVHAEMIDLFDEHANIWKAYLREDLEYLNERTPKEREKLTKK